VRLGVLAGSFAIVALWELLAPRRALENSKTVRWTNNLALAAVNIVVVRVLFPSAVVGVAGRDGGALARIADACVLIPTVDPAHVTAQTEGLQALMWHLLVSHPQLATRAATWESGPTAH